MSASGQVGAVVQHGGVAYVVDAFSVAGTSLTYSLTPVGGGSALSVTSSYTAQPCNLMNHVDALQIGWMIAAAWVGVYGLCYLARVVRDGWGGGDYGNT